MTLLWGAGLFSARVMEMLGPRVFHPPQAKYVFFFFAWWLSGFQKGGLRTWVGTLQTHFLGFLLTKAKPVANPDSHDEIVQFHFMMSELKSHIAVGKITEWRDRNLWTLCHINYFYCKQLNWCCHILEYRWTSLRSLWWKGGTEKSERGERLIFGMGRP